MVSDQKAFIRVIRAIVVKYSQVGAILTFCSAEAGENWRWSKDGGLLWTTLFTLLICLP